MNWYPSIPLSNGRKVKDMVEITDSASLANCDLKDILNCEEFYSVFGKRTHNYKAVLKESFKRGLIYEDTFKYFNDL